MQSSVSSLFTSLLLMSLVLSLGLAGCGGAPAAGQGKPCTSQSDCDPGTGTTCIASFGDSASKTCEILCSMDSDCPNSQPCVTFASNVPKYCGVNPG